MVPAGQGTGESEQAPGVGGKTVTEFLSVVHRDPLAAQPGLPCKIRPVTTGNAHRLTRPTQPSSPGIIVPAEQHRRGAAARRTRPPGSQRCRGTEISLTYIGRTTTAN